MDRQAAELNQLSRLLFDKAANRWQFAISIGLLAGLIGMCASIFSFSVRINTVLAGLAAAILASGYFLRFRFEKIHDAAETMRRQSVLSEGLGWPIPRSQFNEWRQRAGKKVLESAAADPLPDDYYETKSAKSAKRLAEMTFESVFWTKNLYRKISGYLLGAIILAFLIVLIVLLLLPILSESASTRVFIVYFIYLAIPVFVSLDLIGMYLRLQRAISALSALEPNLERLAIEDTPDSEQVLRLVSEYNCTLAAGLPIPRWVFSRHHTEIQACWN